MTDICYHIIIFEEYISLAQVMKLVPPVDIKACNLLDCLVYIVIKRRA